MEEVITYNYCPRIELSLKQEAILEDNLFETIRTIESQYSPFYRNNLEEEKVFKNLVKEELNKYSKLIDNALKKEDAIALKEIFAQPEWYDLKRGDSSYAEGITCSYAEVITVSFLAKKLDAFISFISNNQKEISTKQHTLISILTKQIIQWDLSPPGVETDIIKLRLLNASLNWWILAKEEQEQEASTYFNWCKSASLNKNDKWARGNLGHHVFEYQIETNPMLDVSNVENLYIRMLENHALNVDDFKAIFVMKLKSFPIFEEIFYAYVDPLTLSFYYLSYSVLKQNNLLDTIKFKPNLQLISEELKKITHFTTPLAEYFGDDAETVNYIVLVLKALEKKEIYSKPLIKGIQIKVLDFNPDDIAWAVQQLLKDNLSTDNSSDFKELEGHLIDLVRNLLYYSSIEINKPIAKKNTKIMQNINNILIRHNKDVDKVEQEVEQVVESLLEKVSKRPLKDKGRLPGIVVDNIIQYMDSLEQENSLKAALRKLLLDVSQQPIELNKPTWWKTEIEEPFGIALNRNIYELIMKGATQEELEKAKKLGIYYPYIDEKCEALNLFFTDGPTRLLQGEEVENFYWNEVAQVERSVIPSTIVSPIIGNNLGNDLGL